MNKDEIHEKICASKSKVDEWFTNKRDGLQFPIYSSFDVRDSGFKVANIDANIFPAGFNNICQTDKDSATELVNFYLDSHYGSEIKNILLLTEEHTKNAFYWENIHTLSQLIKNSNKQVKLGIPKSLPEPLQVESVGGHKLTVFSAVSGNGNLEVDGMRPDLIVSNNDFSEAHEEWGKSLNLPINPPGSLL